MENEQAAIALLLFRVGPVLCCAPADPVQTIITPQKLTRPPGANEARPGIFYHAEHVVSVSELRHRFGVGEADRTQPGRMIITLLGEEYTAFWVDEIIEVLDTPSEGWGEAPAYLPKGVFSQTLLLKDRIYLYTNFADFENLPESNYLSQYFERLKNNPLAENAPDTTEPETTTQHTVPIPDALTEETVQKIESPEETITEEPDSGQTVSLQAEVSEEQAESDLLPVTEQVETPATPVESDTPPETVAMSTPTEDEASSDNEKAQHADTSFAEVHTTISDQQSEPLAEPQTSNEDTADVPNEADDDTTPILSTEETDYLKPVPSVVPESEQEPDKPALPWKTLAASVVLFVAIASGAVYYLLTTDQETELATSTPEQINEPDELQTESTKQNEYSPSETPSAATDEQEPSADEAENIAENEAPTEDTNAEPEAYRAEITPDNKGVTIVLHTPDEEPALKQAPPQEKPQVPEPADSTQAEKPIKSAKEEIIHIVIKGDTLWAIAEHYVSNPYKYPQLAKLSKITNPDRIYPGNRVRILRYMKNGH